MAARVMARKVGEMTVEELRREQDVISVWIRDVNAPKQARIRELSAEIERREQEMGESRTACK